MIFVGYQQGVLGVDNHQITNTQSGDQFIVAANIVVAAVNTHGIADLNIALSIFWQQIQQR